VPLTILYLLVRPVFSFLVLLSREDLAKDAELPALRHENAVLRRNAGRIRYEPADRVWFAALAQLIPRTPGPGLPRDTGDAAGLAPQAGRQKVRHQQTTQARPAAGTTQHRPSHRPHGQTEPATGLSADPRRTGQARRHHRAVYCL